MAPDTFGAEDKTWTTVWVEVNPNEIAIPCAHCNEFHVLNIADCITWEDVIAKTENPLNTRTGRVYYEGVQPCKNYITVDGYDFRPTDVVDMDAYYKIGY